MGGPEIYGRTSTPLNFALRLSFGLYTERSLNFRFLSLASGLPANKKLASFPLVR